MLERTYEYRIYPSRSQERSFSLISDTTRALYNQMLKDRTNYYRETGTWKRLNPDPFVKESLLMRDLEPSIINWTKETLEKSYRNFFHIRKTKPDRYRPESLMKAQKDPSYRLTDTDLIGYPKIKGYSSRQSWNIGRETVLVTADYVHLPGIGAIKIKLHRPIPAKAKIQYYTVLKKSSGNYYLLIHLQIPEPVQKKELKTALGVALEPGKLAQCSDGRPMPFRHLVDAQEKQIAHAYEKLCRKTPGSRQYEKQRRYLAALYEKRVNQRRDSLHKISREIVQKADFIAIEEPMVMEKKKRLLQEGIFETVSDEAWWTFSKQLQYKSQDEGKRFWKAPGAVPVRFACSGCGVIDESGNRNGQWRCRYCGAQMSSELNAARNLERFGLQYIEENHMG